MRFFLILFLLVSFLYAGEGEKNKSETNNTTVLKYKQEIEKLQTNLKEYKNLIIAKDKEIKKLKNLKTSYKQETTKQQKIIPPNKFPDLILKEEYNKYEIAEIKPATYRLISHAKIYNKVNGKEIEYWEKGTTFTTNIKATMPKKDSWFKITGFFINKTWVKSQSSLWINTNYIKKR